MECVDSAMMELCTCIADKEMTCIVHPTERSLKERIADHQQTIDRKNERILMLQQRVEALEETIRQLYVMAAACPSDALADDFDFCTPLEQAEALLEGE